MIIRYEVEYYDEIKQDICNESGIIGITGTVGEAVDRICEYYDRDNVSSIKVIEYDDILCDSEIEEMLSVSI